MKAIRIHEDGGPEVLRYEDVPDPEPGQGEVLVRLAAASLNHLDVWVRMGLPSVPKPRILGADGAGVVEALGAGVDGFAVGDRVVINPGIEHGHVISVIGEHCDGTHCELIALAAAQVFPLDDALSFEEAAAFPLVYETAYRMLVTKADVQEGEWVLIWGIGGGVATAAFEICRALGAADDRHLGQRREARAGAGLGRRRRGQPPRRRRRPPSRRRPAPASTSSSRRSARRRGRARSRRCGRPGASSSAAPRAARTHRRRCTGSGGSSSPSTARRWGRATTSSAPTSSSARGRARVHVDRVFPLAETRAAHERLEAGEQLGKIVLSIP